MKNILCFLFLASLTACSSAPVINGTQVQEDKVLSRIDGLSSRPAWLKESEVFKVEEGMVYGLGSAVIPGDNRVEAAYRIAENNAKARLAGSIEQRLEYLFQNAEEGTSQESTQARYIGSEASKLTTSSIRTEKVYWEKVAVFNSDGQASIVYRVFARSSIPEKDLKAAIREAIEKRKGDSRLSKSFSEKVDQQWDKFVNAPPEA